MSERLVHKVAFVGTSCIGKTALIDVYDHRKPEMPGLAIVEEAARDFFLANEVEDRFSADSQGRVQMFALQREKEVHASGARMILCDRSVIDAVVYIEAHGDPEGAKRLLDRVEFWLPTYSSFLLLDPTDIPYSTDDVRVENAAKRQEFHEAFLAFFENTGIPYELLSGTLEERVARVDTLITP